MALESNPSEIYAQTLRSRWAILVGIAFFAVLCAGADSLLRPCFLSQASILIPPHDEYGGLDSLSRQIETNERFLATQAALLKSDAVLKEAWARAHSGVSPNRAELEDLRSAVAIARQPFNNLMTISLSLPRRENVQVLLPAILAAYEDRFRKNALAAASQRMALLEAKLEGAAAHAAAAKADLESFIEVPEMNTSGPNVSKAREARRLALLKSLEVALDARQRVSDDLTETAWLLEQPTTFIEIITGPSSPRQANGPVTNAGRGLLAGLFIDMIMIYLFALWKQRSRGV